MDIIKNLANADVTHIKLGEPVKLGGHYIAHASVDGKPIVYQLHPLALAQIDESTVTFDLGESNQLSTHIGEVDKRLISIVHENSAAFFGRTIRADTVEAAYSSNAHDGGWTFQLEPDLVIKDQYGNLLSTDSLLVDDSVTAYAELIGVAIGKATIKPSWKLHKILVYKVTQIDDAPSFQKPAQENDAGQGTESVEDAVEEEASFYPDAVEP